MKSPVPLIRRIPAAVLGCVWLLVIGTPKLTVRTITPGFTAAGLEFVHEIRTLPPPGTSATPWTPEAPTSVRPVSDAFGVTPGSAGTAPIAPPVEEMAHTTCAFDGLASVNTRPKNIVGTNTCL